MNLKLLAIDLGSTPGWAYLNVATMTLLGAGGIDARIKTGEGGGMRPFRFRRAVISLLKLEPDLVVYEDVKRHLGTTAAHVYGELRGVLLEECEVQHPIMPVTLIPVGVWKKAALGKGNANKDQIMAWAKRVPGWPPDCESQDAADAVGVAVGYARTELG